MSDFIQEKKEKIAFNQLLPTVWWSMKWCFKFSPFWFLAHFVNEALQRSLPILQAFITAKIVGELFSLLGSGSAEISNSLWILITLNIFLIFFTRVTGLFNNYIYIRFRYVLDLNTHSYYLARLVALDMGYHEDPEFKTLIGKMQDTLSWRVIEVWNRCGSLFGSIIGLILGIGTFFSLNILLVFAVIAPVIIDFIINSKIGRDVWGIWNTKGEDKKNASHALEAFNSKDVIQEAKIYGFGDYIANKFRTANLSFIKSEKNRTNLRYRLLSFNSLFSAIIFGFLNLYLILQTVSKVINIEGYTFYLQASGNISDSFGSLQSDISAIYEYSLYMQDLRTFDQLPDRIEKPKEGILSDNECPKIEFKNVSFRYPRTDSYILKNLSFTIKPGEKVALVGENGAGKTTIIKLIARFYDVTDGEILINDINIKVLDLTSYYKLWGVLFQFFARYWFTLRENVGLGNVEDIENIKFISEAGRRAGLDTILPKLTHGYENMLSTDFKDGKDLSGGEWQKIGIARGLFANPKFIVLDEPTSALDALAEARVFEEINKLAVDTSMLIVSHRFATVRNADHIIVLEKGMISEQGSHDELMKKKGLYHEMFTTQAEGYK